MSRFIRLFLKTQRLSTGESLTQPVAFAIVSLPKTTNLERYGA